ACGCGAPGGAGGGGVLPFPTDGLTPGDAAARPVGRCIVATRPEAARGMLGIPGATGARVAGGGTCVASLYVDAGTRPDPGFGGGTWVSSPKISVGASSPKSSAVAPTVAGSASVAARCGGPTDGAAPAACS